MASGNLPVVGNRLVLANVGKYLADSRKINQAISSVNTALREQSTAAKSAKVDAKNIASANQTIVGSLKSMAGKIAALFGGIAKLVGSVFVASVKRIILALAAKKLIDLIFNKGAINQAGKAGELAGRAFANGLRPAVKGIQTVLSKTFGTNNAIGKSLARLAQSSLIDPNAMGTAGQKAGAKFAKVFNDVVKPIITGELEDGLGTIFGKEGKAVSKLSNMVKDRFLSGGGGKKASSGGASSNLSVLTNLQSKATEVMESLKGRFASIGQTFQGLKTNLTNPLKGMMNAFKALPPQAKAVIAALGAVAVAAIALPIAFKAAKAAITTFVDLGKRGSGITGIARGFDMAARAANQFPLDMFNKLREASGGMVSNVELMRNANVALAGSTGEVAKEFGQKLPELLKIARAQSASTGESVDHLFQSLVSGVKRSSPMLIDNTGLVLKLGAANEAMAQQLGKSVEQLTAEEKQIALLNATIAAGAPAVAAMGEQALTAADYQAQIATSQQNILDTLSLSIQPLYTRLTEFAAGFFASLEGVATTLAPLISEAMTWIGSSISGLIYVFQAVGEVFAPVIENIQYFVAVAVYASQYLRGSFAALGANLASFLEPLKGAVTEGARILALFVPFLAAFRGNLFIGGARAFGALAGGIISAFNSYIAPAVIRIATFIADFLVGESPPPKGPLSKIDKGGGNVMVAWLQGFTGVSLDPVERVAAAVTEKMGNVASMSLEAVESRLNALDAAIQPFENRLTLVKAKLEAMTEPLNKAKEIIERQLEDAVQAMNDGGDASVVRQLDKQLEAVNARINAAQRVTDQEELQLAMAKAKVAEERVALEIRKQMLSATQKETSLSTSSGSGGASSSPKDVTDGVPDKASGGGGESTPSRGGSGGGITGGDSSLNALLGQSGVDQRIAAIGDAFKGGLLDNAGGAEGLAEFNANVAELQTQSARINQGVGGIKNKITGAFDGIETELREKLNPVKEIIDGVFGTGSDILASISSFSSSVNDILSGDANPFTEFKNAVTTALPSITNTVSTTFGLGSTLYNLLLGEGNPFKKFATSMQGENNPFTQFSTSLETDLANIQATISTYMGPEGALSMALFGEEGFSARLKNLFQTDEGSVFTLLETQAIDGLDLIRAAFDGDSDILAGLKSHLSGEDSTLQQIISETSLGLTTIRNLFKQLGGDGEFSIVSQLSNLGNALGSAIYEPIASVLNGVIDAVATAIDAVAGIVNEFIKGYNLGAGLLGQPTINEIDVGSFESAKIPPTLGGTYHKGGEVRATLLQGEGVLSIPMMKTLTNLERMLVQPVYSQPVVAAPSSQSVDRSRHFTIQEFNNYNPEPSTKTILDVMQAGAIL